PRTCSAQYAVSWRAADAARCRTGLPFDAFRFAPLDDCQCSWLLSAAFLTAYAMMIARISASMDGLPLQGVDEAGDVSRERLEGRRERGQRRDAGHPGDEERADSEGDIRGAAGRALLRVQVVDQDDRQDQEQRGRDPDAERPPCHGPGELRQPRHDPDQGVTEEPADADRGDEGEDSAGLREDPQ